MKRAGRRRAVLAAILVLVLVVVVPGQAGAVGPSRWGHRIDAAKGYAKSRAGTIAFALVDQRDRLHAYKASAVAPSASLLKPMLLVAYLRMASVRHRPLSDYEQSLLGPMIRRSDNDAASSVLGLVAGRGSTGSRGSPE
jgi:hypothetical protein